MPGPALAVALVADLALAQPPASPPERPEAFYVLSRAPLPSLDVRDLPTPVRSAYRRWSRAREKARGAHGHGSTERRRRLELAAREASAELRELLWRQRGALGPSGWLLLGEVMSHREADSYLAEMRSYEEAVRTWGDDVGVEPVLDQSRAIGAWRRAAAGAPDGSPLRAWAYYLEAFAWIQMHRPDQADAALRVVVAAGAPARLVHESCFRLGDHAFERSDWLQAVGWYRCARTDRYPQLEALTLYKGAWASWLGGLPAEALALVADVPGDAPENVLSDVVRLRDLISATVP